jgi:hypothetical protein
LAHLQDGMDCGNFSSSAFIACPSGQCLICSVLEIGGSFPIMGRAFSRVHT